MLFRPEKDKNLLFLKFLCSLGTIWWLLLLNGFIFLCFFGDFIMTNRVKVLVLLILSLVVLQVSATKEEGDFITVDFSIVKNGEQLHQGNISVPEGQEGSLSLSGRQSEQPDCKVVVSAKQQEVNNKQAIAVDFKYLTYNGSTWVTEAEPKVVSFPGEEAVVSLSGNNQSLDITLKAVVVDRAEMLQQAVVVK